MEDHTDNDWTDLICAATEGRFFDFNGNKCRFVVGASTKVSGGVSGSTTREGVTYEGPHLFHYTDSRWGKIINNNNLWFRVGQNSRFRKASNGIDYQINPNYLIFHQPIIDHLFRMVLVHSNFHLHQ